MADRYDIDPKHSRLGFSAKHLMVTTVRGGFRDFEGYVTTPDGDPTKGEVVLRIKAASIDTGVEDRDNHLRSGDFLDVEAHPEIAFQSRAIEKDGDDYRVSGDLTILGVSRPITLHGTVEGKTGDPWGMERVATVFTGKLNREEWGLTWNKVLDQGALLVSREIKLELDVTVARKLEVAATA